MNIALIVAIVSTALGWVLVGMTYGLYGRTGKASIVLLSISTLLIVARIMRL